MNPLDQNGDPYLCNSCGSFRHYSKDCQHAYETQFNEGDEGQGGYDPEQDEALKDQHEHDGEPVHPTHYVGVRLYEVLVNNIEEPKDIFLTESEVAKLCLDTGCVSSVSGLDWGWG